MENKLIKYKGEVLTRVERAISLTDKLLNSDQHQTCFYPLVDTLPVSIYYESINDSAVLIFQANSQLPIQAIEVFAIDFQESINVHLLQGFADKASHNSTLMRVSLENIAKAPKSTSQVEVTFRIDTNGILSLTTSDNFIKIVIIEISKGLSKQQIEMLREREQKRQEFHTKVDTAADSLISFLTSPSSHRK